MFQIGGKMPANWVLPETSSRERILSSARKTGGNKVRGFSLVALKSKISNPFPGSTRQSLIHRIELIVSFTLIAGHPGKETWFLHPEYQSVPFLQVQSLAQTLVHKKRTRLPLGKQVRLRPKSNRGFCGIRSQFPKPFIHSENLNLGYPHRAVRGSQKYLGKGQWEQPPPWVPTILR